MSVEFGKQKRTARSFMAKAMLPPDPLADVQYTGSVEADSMAEFAALEAAYKSRRRAEDKRFKDATDSEFWVALTFRSRADKEAFLAAAGAAQLGDKYVDGHALAAILGIPLSYG